MESKSSQLCVACGLCCDGAINLHAFVEANEDIKAFESAGIKLTPTRDGRYRLDFPCARFSEGKCQTYNCRPAICHSYRCKLLKRHDHGHISHEQARKVVEIAKGKIQRVTALAAECFPDLRAHSLRELLRTIDERFAELDPQAQREFRKKHGDLLVQRRALELYLMRHFFRQRDVREIVSASMLQFVSDSETKP